MNHEGERLGNVRLAKRLRRERQLPALAIEDVAAAAVVRFEHLLAGN
jgi:hypothetical protein